MPKGKPYPPEFRGEAVQLAGSSDRSIRAVADEIGVAHETLRAWIKQADADDGGSAGLTTAERDELRKLRKESAQLRMENEFLKNTKRRMVDGETHYAWGRAYRLAPGVSRGTEGLLSRLGGVSPSEAGSSSTFTSWMVVSALFWTWSRCWRRPLEPMRLLMRTSTLAAAAT